MTQPPVITHQRAAELPAAWDAAAGDGFLDRATLDLLEQVNPCDQRYHLAPGNETNPASIAVTYRHRLDLFSFARGRFRLRIPVRIVGVPCSVASPGLAQGAAHTATALLSHLCAQPGLTLALNLSTPALGPAFASGPTLPTCRLPVSWPDFPSYLAAMRSPYRRRARQALARGAELKIEALDDPTRFDDSLHALYLNVFRRSRYPLECLTANFFRSLPALITVFRAGDRPAGFVQTVRRGDRLIFLFGGLDDALRDTYDTYFFMLLHIVRLGIESGCREIDLGQTAETSKLRLGAAPIPLHLHATHRSAGIRWILRRAVRGLSYTPPRETHHVFHN